MFFFNKLYQLFQEKDSDSSEYDDDVKDPDYICSEEEVKSDDNSDDDESLNLRRQELPHSSIKGTNDC